MIKPILSGKIKILLDCPVYVKGSKIDFILFKEGYIVEYSKIIKEKTKSCTGAPNGYKYFYLVKESNALIPKVFGKEI
jgi:hypothetical protein